MSTSKVYYENTTNLGQCPIYNEYLTIQAEPVHTYNIKSLPTQYDLSMIATTSFYAIMCFIISGGVLYTCPQLDTQKSGVEVTIIGVLAGGISYGFHSQISQPLFKEWVYTEQENSDPMLDNWEESSIIAIEDM